MNVGDKIILTENPSWSSKDRTGWEVEVVELEGTSGKYLAYKDKLGVTWPI